MYIYIYIHTHTLPGGFHGNSVVKDPPANAGDTSSTPVLGRSLGEENGTPLQYSCLGNPMDRGAWQTIACRVAKESDTTEHSLIHSLCVCVCVCVCLMKNKSPFYSRFPSSPRGNHYCKICVSFLKISLFSLSYYLSLFLSLFQPSA